VFGRDSEVPQTVETHQRGEAVIEKIADQLDKIVAGLESDAERRQE